MTVHDFRLPWLAAPARLAVLPNGHRVVAIPRPGDLVRIQTVVRTGSVNEPDALAGVSHLLEHLLFKGTARHPCGTIDRLVEAMGGRFNASTSRDVTQYHITVPRAPAGNYASALDLHSDMLLSASLSEEEIGPPFDPAAPPADGRRERFVVFEEISMGRDEPWRRGLFALAALQYPTHPYRREVIGTPEVIASVPRSAIHAYYRTWYLPSHLITLVVGDLDPDRVIADVEAAFAFPDVGARTSVRIPDADSPASAVPPVDPPPTSPRIADVPAQLNVAYLLCGFLTPPAADLGTTVALDAVCDLLGNGDSSRLHSRLVETEDTPFISAGASHWAGRYGGSVLVYGVAHAGRKEEAFDRLRTETARLLDEPATAAEMEKTRTRVRDSFAADSETTGGACDSLADSFALVDSPALYTDYLPLLATLTPDDLAAAARDHLAPSSLCAVRVAPNP